MCRSAMGREWPKAFQTEVAACAKGFLVWSGNFKGQEDYGDRRTGEVRWESDFNHR